jgi:serine/threonine protein kinase
VTRPVAAALAGQSGVDVDGYRDYRGVPSVGAWAWLDDYGFGVITEIDADEAFAPLHYLRLIFAGLLVLLACAGAAALGSSFFVVRLRREVQQAQQVGQYTLERLIGEGGMGQVYLARHALLRRPTAVKLLKPGPHSRQAVARFEREVQLASRLTHPNTIDIYDFGQTPEGDLYYAMEYLPGVTLDQLLRSDGAVPPGRAVHIMRQVCRSLQEAHGIGLIHRDIKPQNIMLCERGGEYDFVKVLDFGLVKQVAQSDVPPITTDVQVRGTPMYLAPEAVTDPQHVDARADIYAVGVVLYNLLTNRPPWEANNLAMLFHLLATRDPPRPAQTSQIPIPQTLDDLVVACLARDPSQRPQTIQEILAVLDSDLGLAPWTQEQARQWWRQRPATPDTTPLNRSIHASA